MVLTFTLSAILPAEPEEVYDSWLDSRRHSAMTGAEAHASAKAGAEFTAWDGYISGRNIALERPRRIVQSWRTSQFAETDPESRIEVLLEKVAGGTKLTLHHSNVPDGHTSYRDGGWQDYYFAPMQAYFSRRR
jgi:activator of HSP90 ATPase